MGIYHHKNKKDTGGDKQWMGGMLGQYMGCRFLGCPGPGIGIGMYAVLLKFRVINASRSIDRATVSTGDAVVRSPHATL